MSILKDDLFFDHLARTATMVADTFGPYVEVLVHDLRRKGNPIYEIANGQLTQRKKGDKTTVFGLLDDSENMPAQKVNYEFLGPNGQSLKSSTTVYHNDLGEPIAAMSINFDTTFVDQAVQMLKQITDYSAPFQVKDQDKHFMVSPKEIRETIFQYMVDLKLKPNAMTNADKKKLVVSLYNNGHFNKRGIVKMLSDELGLTRTTIYNYVKSISGRKA